MLTGTKRWFESRAVWGSIVAVLALIAGAFGYTISGAEQEAVVLAVTGLVAGAAELYAIYGRIKAKREIE